MEKLYTAREAAEILGIGVSTVYDRINEGRIACLKSKASGKRVKKHITHSILYGYMASMGKKKMRPKEISFPEPIIKDDKSKSKPSVNNIVKTLIDKIMTDAKNQIEQKKNMMAYQDSLVKDLEILTEAANIINEGAPQKSPGRGF